jgi:hypothetical protein
MGSGAVEISVVKNAPNMASMRVKAVLSFPINFVFHSFPAFNDDPKQFGADLNESMNLVFAELQETVISDFPKRRPVHIC